jgi:hypothetical protein
MTATQAPRTIEAGSGQVVDAVYQNETTTTTQGIPQHKRTTLLSTLTPGERKAFLQEQLDQSAIFRQIACAKNGVVGPVDRNLIGDEPTRQEIREESTRVGLSEQEVRRREEIARREAMIEVREEVMRRQEAMALQQAQEDAARRQAELDAAAARADLAAKQADAAAKQAEADAVTAKKKTAPVLVAPPPQLVQQPVPVPVPAPVGISEADAQRREDLARKEAEVAAKEEAWRNKMAVDQIRNQPPTGNPNMATDSSKPFWTTAKVATATGLGTAAAVGLAAWGLTGESPFGGSEPTAATQPAESSTLTDRETLLLLESQGLSAPRTPLGEKILEAFEKDPSLRERVMTDVEKTLLAE